MGDAVRGKGQQEVFASAMECERAFYQAFTARDLPAMEAVWADEEPSCIPPGGGLLRDDGVDRPVGGGRRLRAEAELVVLQR